MTIVLFVLAASFGAITRWKLTDRWGRVGTWALNMAGALGLGFLTGLGGTLVTVVGTAGIGALTTVSGVAREVSVLASVSQLRAALYLFVTLVTGICAAWIGVHWGM
ncbi:MAG: CrcB family protein [Actinomycetota bacterium]|jgi:fluoride ion exporter CrcB/FEX|nr:CrcB family protein [Actinomycetota bacterium]|tara:strand:+ start:7122 stop:7442 length:321 start_codon:yes stop_codon:yes gene_type:complete